MTAFDDRPLEYALWTTLATETFPDLAWAIQEIDPEASLDTLCVELESIAGVSAYQIRITLLNMFRDQWDRASITVEQAAAYHANRDRRLTIWAACACVRENLARNVDTELAMLIVTRVEQWCAGENYAKACEELAVRAYDLYNRRPAESNAWPLILTMTLGMLPLESEDRTSRSPRATDTIVRCARGRGYRNTVPSRDNEERYKRVIYDSFATYPVWEPR